jgi:hypothetical protein
VALEHIQGLLGGPAKMLLFLKVTHYYAELLNFLTKEERKPEN